MPTYVPQPLPLFTCPGREIWERYRGQEWILFVDESFFEFFDLMNPRGYLCHGAVGLPASEYDNLKIALAPLFDRYRELTSPGQKEFKHSEFKRIEYPQRKRLTLRLRDALAAHGAFVAAFFTPLRAFVLERVRFHVCDEMSEVPAEHAQLYEAAATELRAELAGPGAAGVIARFVSYPVGAAANMLAYFDSRFRLFYDPRETSEDRAVAHDVREFMEVSERVFNVLGGRYLGAECGRTSEQEIGLQLADLIAGEARLFFQANDVLMSFGSSLTLIDH